MQAAGSRWSCPEINKKEVSMSTYYHIGLDIHKRTISYCIKTIDGSLIGQGKIAADRKSLDEWAKGLPGSWSGAMEATIFTGWVYDFLKPYAVDLKVAHPEMLKAMTAAKKKNDRADAEKIVDLLRVNLLPECHMLSEESRDLRRVLRYRNHIVRTAVKMQNKISGLLMQVGVSYTKRRIHGENTSMRFWKGLRKSLLP
jgi:transposase